jgi:hypothetical protein
MIRVGDPGYSTDLDRDDDGMACESQRAAGTPNGSSVATDA